MFLNLPSLIQRAEESKEKQFLSLEKSYSSPLAPEPPRGLTPGDGGSSSLCPPQSRYFPESCLK